MVTEIERLWHVLRDLPHFLWPFEPKKRKHTHSRNAHKSVCVSMYIWGVKSAFHSTQFDTKQRSDIGKILTMRLLWVNVVFLGM